MDEQQERRDKRNSLAREVLLLSRNTLLVNLRFLDMALSRFTLKPIERSTLMTDGQQLLYHPKHVLSGYKAEKESVVRDYLHVVLHCVFRHMYAEPTLNRTYWDLACDIAVENIITELGLRSTAASREREQQKYIDAIRKDLKKVTAEKIYAYFRQTQPDEARLAEIRGTFYADNHEIWYMTSPEAAAAFGIPDGGSGNDDSEDGGGASSRAEAAADWKEIGEKLQTDLETFSRMQGDRAESLMQSLQTVNREKYDYTAFLKKFAVMGETMKINDDEFDYVYYTYGLDLYEKMPLIEPLEYKEVRRIRDFVIAIDTSGSVSGELVQKFVQKTYNILKSTESFFRKINLHIIQCDATIQEHIKITSQKEFDAYLKTMQIHGLGGTDFRPVFQTVDELIQCGEFTNLKGMVYFTDGFGKYPARKPDYETAFVFIDDDSDIPLVPAWAIKIILRSDEI